MEAQKLITVSDYYQVFRTAEKKGGFKESEDKKAIKVAYLNDFTMRSFDIFLKVECLNNNIIADTYFNDFNQFMQGCLNPQSDLFKFNPDIIFMAFSNDKFITGSETSQHYSDWLLGQVKVLTDSIEKHSTAYIIISNCIIPSGIPNAFLESAHISPDIFMIRNYNQRLSEMFHLSDRIFVFDIDGFASMHGKKNVSVARDRLQWQMDISMQELPQLAKIHSRIIRSIVYPPSKCLVLDLDNTLWGGIAGEEGMNGIKLGPEPPGNAFVEFQKTILSYYEQGVVLAINSKNNLEDVLPIIRSHPCMVLKEKHFACIRANWKSKAENTIEIARELNVGLNSLVFVDDNPVERLAVKTGCPEVTVIDLPDDVYSYAATLNASGVFDSIHRTEDDAKRGKMYSQERLRKESSKSFESVENYLAFLNMEARIELLSDKHLNRAVQMCAKTNQFNLTTRRHTIADIQKMMADESCYLFVVHVNDRFGDNGICGFAVVYRDQDHFTFTDFILSCRVIGRKVEQAFIKSIISYFGKNHGKYFKGIYKKTRKNAPCSHFYRDVGFTKQSVVDETTVWHFDPYEASIESVSWIVVSGIGEDAFCFSEQPAVIEIEYS